MIETLTDTYSMKSTRWLPLLLMLFVAPLWAQGPDPLVVRPEELYVEAREDGFHLFIKKVTGRESIILTESFERDDHKIPSYSLRAFEANGVNGQEKRLLDGKALPNTIFSLIDSTSEPNVQLGGEAFHILISPKVQYGYPNYNNTRYGVYDLLSIIQDPKQVFWFSVRAFSRPYGDYTGTYKDNAYEMKSITLQKPPVDPTPVVTKEEPPADTFRPKLIETFERISRRTVKSPGGKDLIEQIQRIIETQKGETLDLVIALDTTKSMIKNLDEIKRSLLDPIRKEASRFKSFRIGWVFYRDYMEEYLNRVVGFQEDWERIQAELNRARADGGGDIPEAVFEALYASLTQFDWQAQSRLIILVGDSPPHEIPRGKITEADVMELVGQKLVEVVSIMLPY